MRNKVTLIGHLGNKPEIKTFEGDKRLTRLSIATNESYKNKQGEKVTDTTWAYYCCMGKLSRHTC